MAFKLPPWAAAPSRDSSLVDDATGNVIPTAAKVNIGLMRARRRNEEEKKTNEASSFNASISQPRP